MYWQDRASKAQSVITEKKREEIEKQLVKYYSSSQKKIIGQFEKTYLKLLSDIEKGKEPTPADLYKLDSYWELQGQLKSELEKLGNKQATLLSKRFIEEYQLIYESLAIQGEPFFNTLDAVKAQQMINQIWCADGKSWSQRVWMNLDKLQEALNDNLIHCVVAGNKSSELKKILMRDFGVAYNRADTLVRTELAHIQTQASRDRYADAGVQEVEVWADKDERRCEVCGKLHKMRYPVGAQMPIPAHPNCRCVLLPVIE